MKKIRPVFKVHGGKYYISDFVIAHFPQNFHKYVEGCGGAASVLLNKPQSLIEVYNDADPAIANIFHHLKENPEAFLALIQGIEYAEASFDNAKIHCHEPGLIGAVSELVVRRMSRGGLRKAFSWSERLRGGRPGDLNAWETYKEHLPLIINRLHNVQVENKPVAELIAAHDAPDTFFYVDPPYLPSTRQSNNVYSVEMTEEQHIELLKIANDIQGRILISGYPSPLYEKYLKGWKMNCRPIANHSSQSKQKEKRIEVLWMNYKLEK
jgi:DNA adenine methylase